MQGTFYPATGRVEWSAGRWIDRPLDYVTIDLVGVLGPDRGTMRGDVIGPGCSTFELGR